MVERAILRAHGAAVFFAFAAAAASGYTSRPFGTDAREVSAVFPAGLNTIEGGNT